MRGGRGRNGQARHAIKRPSVRGRARCPETIGVCNTAGERRGAALCQGTRPCRTPPRHICSRLFHMHTSVEGHQALQPSWSINGFSTPLHPPPPPRPCFTARRVQADVPAFACTAAFRGIGAHERRRGPGVQNLQGSRARRKQRCMATVMPSRRAAAVHERKKSVKAGGGGTLAGRTG